MSKVLVFDTETTNIPEWKLPSGDDCQPHIVQLAAALVDEETRDVISSIDLVIKPEGWIIPEDETAVHGITNEYANKHGVSEELAVKLFIQLWNGNPRVAFNRTFDQRIIRIALKRYADEDTQNRWAEKDNFHCAMLLSRKAMAAPKNPKLEEAYKHFTGKDLEDAHSAMPDTLACLEVYWAVKPQESEAA